MAKHSAASHRFASSRNTLQRLRTALASLAALALGLTIIPLAATTAAFADEPVSGPVVGFANVPGDAGWELAGLDDIEVTAWRLDTDEGTAATVTIDEGSAYTDADGEWEFTSLPVGDYLFEVNYRGAVPNVLSHTLTGTTWGSYSSFSSIEEALYELVSQPDEYVPITLLEAQPLADVIYSSHNYGAVAEVIVLDSATSSPLIGQPVELWRNSITSVDGAEWVLESNGTTNAGGTAIFEGLHAGSYTVRAGGASGYIAEFWDDSSAVDPAWAEFEYLYNDNDPSGDPRVTTFNFSLDAEVTISGTVTNTSKSKLKGIDVTAYRMADDYSDFVSAATTKTASNGTYTLKVAPGIQYAIGFAGKSGSTVYGAEYYDDTESILDAELIEISVGDSRTKVNAVLSKGGTITGTVTLAGGGVASASDLSIEACSMDYDHLAMCGQGITTYNDATGAYTISSVGTGDYTVRVTYLGASNFMSEIWNNVWDSNTSIKSFKVSAGKTVKGIDIELDPGAQLSGRVTDDASNGVDGAVITIFEAYGSGDVNYGYPLLRVQADENGYYSSAGLLPGLYALRATVPGDTLAAQWNQLEYSPTTATVIALSLGEKIEDIDFTLEASATISGTVTAPDAGPVSSARVSLYRWDSVTSQRSFAVVDWDYYVDWEPERHEYTNSSGQYSFDGLAPGYYSVFIDTWYSSHGNLLSQYVGAPAGAELIAAQRFLVESDDNDVVNLQLIEGAAYTGRVVDSDNNPIFDAYVSADNRGASYGSAWTDIDGFFTITGLLGTGHEIYVSDGNWPEEYSSREFYAPGAELGVSVDLGTIELTRFSTIAGVVIGTDGKPVKNLSVAAEQPGADGYLAQVESGWTDASGRFEIQVPVGDTYLWFEPSQKSAYGAQYLGGGQEWALSDVTRVEHEGSYEFVEARLLKGGSISGTVKNRATGKAIKGARVGASRVTVTDGETWDSGWATTSSSGKFAIPGLSAGSYDVFINQRSSGWGLKTYAALETSRYVPDKGKVTVNVSLDPTIAVSGTVRDTNNTPMEGIQVRAIGATSTPDFLSPRTEGLDLAYTDDKGNYTLRLDPGSYYVQFSDPQSLVASQFLGGTELPGDAGTQVITVTHKSKAVKGKNIVLTPGNGGINATVKDTYGDPVFGSSLQLARIDDGELVSSTQIGDIYRDYKNLNEFFPILGLGAGTYALLFDNQGVSTVVEDIVVADGVTELGEITLNPVDAASDYDLRPRVDQANPPTLVGDIDAQVGDVLSVTTGSWSESPTAFHFQWMRGDRSIPGATTNSYLVMPGDAGHALSVRVGASNDSWYWINLSARSNATNPVLVADAAEPITNPYYTGEPRVGKTLTANPGTWDTDSLNFNFRWIRTSASSPDMVVSTSTKYKLTTKDVWSAASDTRLDLEVTASRPGVEPATYRFTVDEVVAKTAMKQTKASKAAQLSDGFSITAGTWSPSGATFEFEWRVYEPDGSFDARPGTSGTATSSILSDQLVRDGVQRVEAIVTASKSGYSTSSKVVTVRSGAQLVFDIEPAVTGTLQPGHVLSVDTAVAETTPAATSYKYQWYRGSSKISKATKATYTVTANDVGKELSVQVTASATGHPASAPLTVVAGTPTAVTGFTPGTVTIEGTLAVGRKLTVNNGAWSPTPSKFAYQWYRDGAKISKATKSSYTLTAKDLDAVITVTSKGTLSGYTAETVTGTATGPVVALELQSVEAPTLGTTARVGSKLTAGKGTWDLAPKSYTYQWYRNGVAISGATSSSFTPTVNDLDIEIAVEVTAKRSGIPDSSPTMSNSLTVQPGAAIKASKAPVISFKGKKAKTAKVGQTLDVTAGTWPAVGLSIHYLWEMQVEGIDGLEWVAVPDADDSKSYFVDEYTVDDNGVLAFRVVVTAVRPGYLDAAPVVSNVVKVA